MGSCLAVEVREQPVPYYDRSGQLRHTIVRPKNKSAYRLSDESSLYRPRSRLSIRRDDFRLQDNDYYRPPAQAGFQNNLPFEPLPPPAPPRPVIHQNNPPDGGIVELPNLPPIDLNGIQVIEDGAEIIRRSPHSHRSRSRAVVHSSRRSGNERRYYDDSDDDSWVERSPRRRYSDETWVEVYRPGRRRSGVWRSRSRNNSRPYRW